MGNSNTSEEGLSTKNSEGENVINFNLFGGADEEQVVTRDFSLDLVDYVNFDDKYMDGKYPGWKEQREHFDALLGAFTKCNLDLERYEFGKLGVPADYMDSFMEVCPMNEYVKFRTGKYNHCIDGIFPTPVRPLTLKEAKEMHVDLLYCGSSGGIDDDMSIFESRRMRWAEPETLLQVRPKIMSVLKSLKFKPDSDEPTNIISNYYLEEKDDEKKAEEKINHIRDQIATKEFEEMTKCTTDAKDLERECIVERQVYGLLVGTALCKSDILKCLERNSSLHGNKLEEVASFDYANCVSSSPCFNRM